MPKTSVWVKLLGAAIGGFLLFLVVGLLFGESDKDRDARYQIAKRECAEKAARIAIPGSGGGFNRRDEAVAIKALTECMSAKGFDVKLQ